MRVTSHSYSENLLGHLQTLTRRQGALQNQIASGQRIQNLSEDPMAAQQILGLRDESAAALQYRKNIQVHQEFATAGHSSLQALQKVINRAQEIAFSADGFDSPEDLKTFGREVGELIKHALQLANRQHRGEHLFAGTKSGEPAFRAEYAPNGDVTRVIFQGNSAQAQSEIAPGVLTASRIPGANDSGAGETGLFEDSRTGADLFGHLIALRDQLMSGDVSAIQSESRPALKKDEESILYHVAGNAALLSRLETMLSLNKDQGLALEQDLSRRTDIDYAEVVVRLSQQQTAYQATLQSAASILNLSLLSFLR